MRELKMFQITVNISLMLLPKEGSEVGKPPVFTLLSAKGCIYMCEPVGGPTLPPTDGATCTVSWIPTTPKGFLQFCGLISARQCPWEWTSGDGMSLFRGLSRERSIFYRPRWSYWPVSYSHSGQKALRSPFPILYYILQRLSSLPAGWNSSVSVYSRTAPNPCKPSFLLLVTSPTVARDTQCLSIQGLASVNEECFILDEREICL